MALFLVRPEVGYVEAGIEICAEVVHPADGKGKVHAEFEDLEVRPSEVGQRIVAHSWRSQAVAVHCCGLDARKLVWVMKLLLLFAIRKALDYMQSDSI